MMLSGNSGGVTMARHHWLGAYIDSTIIPSGSITFPVVFPETFT